MPVPNEVLAIYCGLFFVFNDLRWEVVVRFCWYLRNCWPSLFKLTFQNCVYKLLIKFWYILYFDHKRDQQKPYIIQIFHSKILKDDLNAIWYLPVLYIHACMIDRFVYTSLYRNLDNMLMNEFWFFFFILTINMQNNG